MSDLVDQILPACTSPWLSTASSVCGTSPGLKCQDGCSPPPPLLTSAGRNLSFDMASVHPALLLTSLCPQRALDGTSVRRAIFTDEDRVSRLSLTVR